MTLGPDSNRVEFTKCVLQNGTDKIAEEGQWVKIEIKKRFNSNLINPLSQDIDTLLGFSLNPDDEVFTPVRLRIGYFDTYIGEIIHRAVGEMRLGEFAQVSFELDPRLLDESLAQDALDEAVYIDFKFEVNLVEIESGDGMDKSSLPIYRLDENELFDRCTDHKNDANRIFKLGRLRTAFRRYKKSIDYLIIAEQIVNEKIKRLDQNSGIPEIPDDFARNELTNMREKLLAIKSQLYSNLSLLQLKSKSYDMAVINCSKCLSIDSNNVKALFRRGQARMNLKDYDEAIGDFNRALELEPDNVEVKSNLAACERVKKDYERELAANLKKLFT